MRFSVRSSFPATHRIRIDARGTLEPAHAHNWRIEAWFEAADDASSVPVEAHTFLLSWVARYDGKSLNDVAPFDVVNPTAEEVARVFAEESTAALDSARVLRVEVGEAAGFSATYRPSA
jgi:6-pyruvoyltetrahydropterin/6-carboxytetrahydropterin synthase